MKIPDEKPIEITPEDTFGAAMFLLSKIEANDKDISSVFKELFGFEPDYRILSCIEDLKKNMKPQ